MINRYLPFSIRNALFGDRDEFGTIPNPCDSDWKIWQDKKFSDFYQNTQQRGIGVKVSRMAYPIISCIDFGDKNVLEVGPGIIRHLQYIQNKPARYTICDINEDVLGIAEKQLRDVEIPCEAVLLSNENESKLPFADESFEVIVSFNSLEHLYPLDSYLSEMKRILKIGGQLVGCIPCEGGLAWGIGRFLTTRRYVHKNYGINYDKIICWEHPNFADLVIERLDAHFKRKYLKLRPFSFLPMDFNLIANFIYSHTSETA